MDYRKDVERSVLVTVDGAPVRMEEAVIYAATRSDALAVDKSHLIRGSMLYVIRTAALYVLDADGGTWCSADGGTTLEEDT